jgi:hypothetical protein
MRVVPGPPPLHPQVQLRWTKARQRPPTWSAYENSSRDQRCDGSEPSGAGAAAGCWWRPWSYQIPESPPARSSSPHNDLGPLQSKRNQTPDLRRSDRPRRVTTSAEQLLMADATRSSLLWLSDRRPGRLVRQNSRGAGGLPEDLICSTGGSGVQKDPSMRPLASPHAPSGSDRARFNRHGCVHRFGGVASRSG